MARLAELFGLAETAAAVVRRAARHWFEAEGEARLACIAPARLQLAGAAERALVVEHEAVGLPGHFLTHPLSSQLADLSVYLSASLPPTRSGCGRACGCGGAGGAGVVKAIGLDGFAAKFAEEADP